MRFVLSGRVWKLGLRQNTKEMVVIDLPARKDGVAMKAFDPVLSLGCLRFREGTRLQTSYTGYVA